MRRALVAGLSQPPVPGWWVSFKTLRQNQNWERSDQPYTQVQKHIEKIGGSKRDYHR
jgi:hypothetical protein